MTVGLGHHALGGINNRVQGKVYAVEQRDIEDATNIIGGMCQLFQLNIKMLIYPGASHFYISKSLIRKLDPNSTHLPYNLEVNTL